MKKMFFVLVLFLVLTGFVFGQDDNFDDLIKIDYITSPDDSLNKMTYTLLIGGYQQTRRGFGVVDDATVAVRFVRAIYDARGIPQSREYELHIIDFAIIDASYIAIGFAVDGKESFIFPVGTPKVTRDSNRIPSFHETEYVIPLSWDFLIALKTATAVSFVLNGNVGIIPSRYLKALQSML